MRLLRFSTLAILALCLSAGPAGADTFPQERTSKPSFNPPITPALTGSPGPNVYLRTMGAGPPIWAPVPAASVIGPGLGWVKQNPAGRSATARASRTSPK